GVVTGPVAHSDSHARLEGYKAALAEHGLPFVPELCAEGRFTFGSGLRAADALLSLPEPPDAIAAGNDDMAAAALLAAHRRGLVLPRDLAVCGFDDTLIATRVWPALTTVRQPIADMTSQAIDALVEALRDPRARGSDLVLDFTLVERESIKVFDPTV
ncbi:MAG TPA: substrate-binding domain-containing protein, partial [Novosphingobium sp.]|nr:substrate-binding domain-containing protein [Novosphingobium sp.]